MSKLHYCYNINKAVSVVQPRRTLTCSRGLHPRLARARLRGKWIEASVVQRKECGFPEPMIQVQFLSDAHRAYGSTAEYGIRIAKIRVQFSVGPL